jgi:probable F420-dependent oxidoreductase
LVRPFRFGYQLRAATPGELRLQARAAEDGGFDVLCTFDHLGENFSALAPLLAAACWTTRIRLCPLVLNNDFHHPALLAQELATVDQLCGGRLEVGIGAGHSFTEYTAAGIDFDPAPVRKARIAEAVEILRRLLDGETVTHAGEHYRLDNVSTQPAMQDHVPILVGVNGRAALAHAARHADIIGLTMMGRTLADGQRHEVRWASERLDDTVDWIRSHAGDRGDDLELNALVQAVVITDDRQAAAEALAGEVEGLTVSDALATPFVALGTHEEIARHLLACRERWGISYFVVRDIDAFAPVIEILRRSVSPPQ